MNPSSHRATTKQPPQKHKSSAFLLDLVLYLSVMFLVRELYFPELPFIANGLFWSLTTLVFASWRIKARQITWSELGLCYPQSYQRAIVATVAIFMMTVAFVMLYEALKGYYQWGLAPDVSNENAAAKFGNLKNNWWLFFSIMPFILLQSALEEMLDRGFLINWIERTFSRTVMATVLAVLIQAVIFGFRHSHDLSDRSISVALIGLAMGLGYVLFGRNLWPLIIAHGVFNTMSMIDRVG